MKNKKGEKMALIQWNDSLSVNVAEIDRQHQKLIKMINDLSEAMKEGKGNDILGEILTSLVDYTKTHFKQEETYFDRFGYPDADSHKKIHEAFVTKISEFQAGLEEGSLSLSVRVMVFLSDWLRNHINGIDKKYSSFFNAKGLV